MRSKLVVLVIIICSKCCTAQRHLKQPIPGPASIRANGYPFELHEIVTDDGYILETHRIPYGKNESNIVVSRPPVLMMHGILAASESWVITESPQSLAYLLADEGYDVWMANARGTTHSRRHRKYDAEKDKDYWKFSWHEIGYYDMTANIDHILKTTEQKQLFYVGHSQGTTVFFVMCSERPEYNQKIKLMVALAPVAYIRHVKSPLIKTAIGLSSFLERTADLIGLNEVIPLGLKNLIHTTGPGLCETPVYEPLCRVVLSLVCGEDDEQMDKATLVTIPSVLPASCSLKQLWHFGQNIKSGYFRKYDNGYFLNMVRYKRMAPPEYQLERITVPVALFYGKNDFLSTVEDVDKLASRLPRVVQKRLMPQKKFNHLDFLWAKDVYEMLYRDVIILMNKFLQ